MPVGGNMLQSNRSAADITCRKRNVMRGKGEGRLHVELAVKTYQDQSLTKLRDTIKRRVQQRVRRSVPKIVQGTAYLLGDIVATVVENIRHVLYQNRQRPDGSHIGQE